jgi:Family of unknown function (DUF5677)
MTDVQQALQFADTLYASAMNIAGTANVQIGNNWKRDPRVMSVAILCRTLSTFKAALILVRANQVMEARMLARPLYENCLWIAALREQGVKFVEAMVEDDALNRTTLAQITMKLSAQHGADVNNEGAQLLRQVMRQLREAYKNPKKLHADKVAAMGVIEIHYVDYTQLSLDPLHCSMTALGRHVWSKRLSETKTEVNISVEPRYHADETGRTIRLLSRALMAIAITANELLGGTPAGGQLTTAVEEFDRLGWTAKE